MESNTSSLEQAASHIGEAVALLETAKKSHSTRLLSIAATHIETGSILLQHELARLGLPSIYGGEKSPSPVLGKDTRSPEHKEMDKSINKHGQVELTPDQMLYIFETPQKPDHLGYRAVFNKDQELWAVSMKG